MSNSLVPISPMLTVQSRLVGLTDIKRGSFKNRMRAVKRKVELFRGCTHENHSTFCRNTGECTLKLPPEERDECFELADEFQCYLTIAEAILTLTDGQYELPAHDYDDAHEVWTEAFLSASVFPQSLIGLELDQIALGLSSKARIYSQNNKAIASVKQLESLEARILRSLEKCKQANIIDIENVEVLEPTKGPLELDAEVVLPKQWYGVVKPGNKAIVLEMLQYLFNGTDVSLDEQFNCQDGATSGAKKWVLSNVFATMYREGLLICKDTAVAKASLTDKLFTLGGLHESTYRHSVTHRCMEPCIQEFNKHMERVLKKRRNSEGTA